MIHRDSRYQKLPQKSTKNYPTTFHDVFAAYLPRETEAFNVDRLVRAADAHIEAEGLRPPNGVEAEPMGITTITVVSRPAHDEVYWFDGEGSEGHAVYNQTEAKVRNDSARLAPHASRRL